MLWSSKYGSETCLQPTERFAMAGETIKDRRMLFFASLVTLVEPAPRLLTVRIVSSSHFFT